MEIAGGRLHIEEAREQTDEHMTGPLLRQRDAIEAICSNIDLMSSIRR